MRNSQVHEDKYMDKLLAILRNRKIKTTEFRVATKKLSVLLVRKFSRILRKQSVETKHVVLVVILRAGVALLDGAIEEFPEAPVGVLGMKRDEHTYVPFWYYKNLPKLSKKNIVAILDPMLATGGSAEAAVGYLIEQGAQPQNIYFVGVIGAPEGLFRLAGLIPHQNIILASLDKGLSAQKMILPGLGDFGDRFFGTL